MLYAKVPGLDHGDIKFENWNLFEESHLCRAGGCSKGVGAEGEDTGIQMFAEGFQHSLEYSAAGVYAARGRTSQVKRNFALSFFTALL